MELLPEEIKKNTYLYKFCKRGKRAIIYEQIDPEFGKTVAFEVFRRKIDKPKVIFGIQLNEREIFPGNEDFGKWAWTLSSLEKALEKFEFLENQKDDES
jgi:hypothetical protein